MQFADMTFGTEIECYVPIPKRNRIKPALEAAGLLVSEITFGSIHATTPGWKIVPDASLNDPRFVPAGHVGVEVVSPILQGENGIADLIKVANIIKSLDGTVNTKCGLHVHVGAKTASPMQLRNLAKVFLKYEHHFDSLCPISRRSNQFARSNRAQAAGLVGNDYDAVIAAAFPKLDAARSVGALATVMNGGYRRAGTSHYNQERYFKLNFQSMASHGTVEYRQHAGTVEAAKMVAWVRLVVAMTATAFTLKSPATLERPTFAQMMAKVDRPTAKFLAARRVSLNAGVDLED